MRTTLKMKFFFIVKLTRNKTKKQNLRVHNYSQPKSILCRATFCSNYSLLGCATISLAHLATGIFAHSSRQNCYSSFKLDVFCWCTAIFKSYHRFSIGLRSGLWLGHSKTFKCFPLKHLSVALAVCLGSLSCWKVNLRPSLKPLEDKQVSLNNFPLFSTIHCWTNCDNAM